MQDKQPRETSGLYHEGFSAFTEYAPPTPGGRLLRRALCLLAVLGLFALTLPARATAQPTAEITWDAQAAWQQPAFTVTIIFSESVEGFTLEDDIAMGDAAGANFQALSGTTYSVEVTPNPGAEEVVFVVFAPGTHLAYEAIAVIPALPAVTGTEREALEALYDATDGANWTTSTNWKDDTKALGEWHGVTTNSDGQVTHLRLRNNNLVGTLPLKLGDLRALIRLDLRENALSGSIPVEVGHLRKLTYLGLRTNTLSGSIPVEVTLLRELTTLSLNDNALSGEIPATLGRLSKLIYVWIHNNALSGEIPATLGNLSKLLQLYLSNNALSGEIPATLRRLSKLQDLALNSNAALRGAVPSTFPTGLTALKELKVQNTQVTVPVTPAFNDWDVRISSGTQTSTGVINLAATNSRPSGLWADGTTLWVADEAGGTVYAYRLNTGARDTTQDIALHQDNNSPTGLWSDGTTLWVLDPGDKVYAYDLAAGTRDAPKDTQVPSGSNTYGLWGLRFNNSDNEPRDALWMLVIYSNPLSVDSYRLTTDDRYGQQDANLLKHLPGEFQLLWYARGFWWNGLDTLWVSDIEDARLYAYTANPKTIQTGNRARDVEQDRILAPDNLNPTAIWSDGTTWWVADSRVGKVFVYGSGAGPSSDTTPPALSRATVDGTTLVLAYNEALDMSSEPATSDFTVIVDSTSRPVSTVVISGRTVRLTLEMAVTTGQTMTVSYTPGTRPLRDSAGNAAPALSNQPVTITDDDEPVVMVMVSFGVPIYTVNEGAAVDVTVRLSADPERQVEIPLTTTNRDGVTDDDYAGVPSSVTFTSGTTARTFTVTASDDDVGDGGESVQLGFGSPLPPGVEEGSPATTVVTITELTRSRLPPLRLGGTGGGGAPACARDGHGNQATQATDLELSTVTAGTICPAADVDYFTVTAPGRGLVFVDTTGGVNLRGTILQNETVLATGPTGSRQNDRLGARVQAGPVVVAVQGQGGTTGPYAVEITFVQGYLENPGADSFQSGIGVISGWVCEAEEIVIELNGAPQAAAYGTERLDTARVCGDTDNGFGLLFNWNLLGNGEHTVVALVDGVELSRTTVTVTTLGTEFVRDVVGSCAVADFPMAGETALLTWQQTSQNFVLASERAPSDENRRGAIDVGYLENPGPNSFQSGIGVLSGWACEGEDVVIELNGEPQVAAYGTERLDTLDACGDTDNGFGLLFNWNLLGDGVHDVVAYVDDVELGRATVRVTTLGAEFLRDVAGECTVADFPTLGETVTLEWQQNSQNFVITDME